MSKQIQINLKLSIVVVLFGLASSVHAQEKKIIQSEANDYCKCHKAYLKKVKAADKKATSESLFGGNDIVFSFEECLINKRNQKAQAFIEGLGSEEKERFQKKVKSAIRKKNQSIDSIYY